jgi:preprotein translocase subunit SecA
MFVPSYHDWLRRRRYAAVVSAVNDAEDAVLSVSDDELRRRAAALRRRARSGTPPAGLVVDAFTLVREASRRTVGMRHFDEQLLAGAALCDRTVVEMQTGEGKTLTATLPLFVFGLYGRGACLATSNDYLARRDADQLRPTFRLLGLSVGAVTAESTPEERRRAYRRDVTYGTGKEFGFDFLRDRLKYGARTGDAADPGSAENASLQREPFFMLVDEADSVLIDDAGTPLIIASAPRAVAPVTAARFKTGAKVAAQLEEHVHFEYHGERKQFELTAAGRAVVRIYGVSQELERVSRQTLYEDVERAVLAARRYHRERQYVVRDGQVAIVDEFTGRIAEGRKWRDGLHQAIEAQEGLEVTDDGGQAARITVQDFFRRYPLLAGMTGTVANSTREFRKVYATRTFVVPTHRPTRRVRMPPRIFSTSDAKWRAIVDEIVAVRAAGRPVLIGTRTIAASQQLSALLSRANVDHDVLNAREIAREADIVATAGRPGAVTVATNMAGRGTDIVLGQGVAEAGGLHVVLTEMHEASRIDRQLVGRGGRQGDPGSYRFFLSLEDELLAEAWGKNRAEAFRRRRADGDVAAERFFGLFLRAQRAVERRTYLRRRQLLYFEKQRKESAVALGLDPYLDVPG